MHQRHQDNFLYVQTYLAIKRILILILILILIALIFSPDSSPPLSFFLYLFNHSILWT